MAEHGHENGHGDNAEYYALRAEAIQALLLEKGVCTLDDILTMADQIDSRSPEDGAKVLAHAWVDPEYKKRLLADAESALLELGYDLPETAPRLTVVENTDQVHNMAVCTLSKCISLTRSYVCWNCASLSPGNPTMRSVTIATPGTIDRTFCTKSLYWALV